MSIKIEGLSNLISSLKAYEKTVRERERICLERLAEIGIDEANVRFTRAQYDGTNDVTVTAPQWLSPTKIAIYATGNSVAFIEFGTGVFYSEQHPLSDEIGAGRGTFGQGKGSQNTWGYYGEGGTNGVYLKSTEKGDVYLTHGNPPSRAMYEADKAIQKQILTIVKQVFSFD